MDPSRCMHPGGVELADHILSDPCVATAPRRVLPGLNHSQCLKILPPPACGLSASLWLKGPRVVGALGMRGGDPGVRGGDPGVRGGGPGVRGGAPGMRDDGSWG